MASILDKYGIKEVADVTFYGINSNGTVGRPVLYLDTLKVSTIEQTAEQADSRGGKGNPKLITWDYGKEINVTLEDALFSAKSMAIMFGNGGTNAVTDLRKTFVISVLQDLTSSECQTMIGVSGLKTLYSQKKISGFIVDGDDIYCEMGGNNRAKVSQYTVVTEKGVKLTASEKVTAKAGEKMFVTFNYQVVGQKVEVSANTFPGTYYITGDTYARSSASGEDEFFQFIIKKAKVTSENTITLEAEGDPSTFSMNLTVLRPDDGSAMMELIKYDLADKAVTEDGVVVDASTNLTNNLKLRIMKKLLLIAVLAMISVCGFARKNVTTTVVSQDTVYYNNQLVKVADREDAEYYRLFAKEDYKGQQRDIFQDYYLNGNIRMEGGYKFLDLSNDNNTVLDGQVITYYPNGKEKWQCNYKNGKRQGYLTLQLRDGSVVVAQYDYGQLVHNYLMLTHANGKMEKVPVSEYEHLIM